MSVIGLHGADWDGTNYYGETEWEDKRDGGEPPSEALRKAINIYQANAPGAVIMSAACYGADIFPGPCSIRVRRLSAPSLIKGKKLHRGPGLRAGRER